MSQNQAIYSEDGSTNFQIASYQTSLSKIMKYNIIYVDKSRYIEKLLKINEPILITRPRSFGKSMMINLIKEVLTLGKDSFPSLAIAKSSLPELQEKYIVLHLDFSQIEDQDSVSDFKHNLICRLIESAINADLPLKSNDPAFYNNTFASVFNEITKCKKPLALLIDEYDAPLNAVLSQPKKYEVREQVLCEFFKLLKSFAIHFSLIYLTGISRCASVGMLSGFNKVNDISYDTQYAGMLGFTEEEVKQYFAPQLKYIAQHKGQSEEQLLADLHKHYDGYCFDEACKIKVFNPWLITSYFNKPFKPEIYPNFWRNVGGLETILNEHYCLKPQELEQTILDLSVLQKQVLLSVDELFEPQALPKLTSRHYLLLTGYLTLKAKANEQTYQLDYPNKFLKRLSQSSLIKTIRAVNQNHTFASEQNTQNINEFLALNILDEHRLKLLQPIVAKGGPHLKTIFQQEVLVEVVLACICTFSSALFIQTEASLGGGRADLVLGFPSHNVIIELKRSINAKKSSKIQHILDEALQQIEQKNYQHLFMQQNLPLLKMAILADSTACNVIGLKTQQV